MATGVTGRAQSRPFYVCDNNTHTHFLIDTGSEVSVLPPSPSDRRHLPNKLTLTAVNDTPIPTFGKRSLTLDLGSFSWIFIVADVQRLILGADFLRHFGLLVDMKRKQLSDATTQLRVQGIITNEPSHSHTVRPKDTGDPYNKLLSEFPRLTQVCSPDSTILHDVTHHTETTGPPVTARPRRLPPERLKVAKREFEHMLQLDVPPQVLGGAQESRWRLAPLWRLSCIESKHNSRSIPSTTRTRLLCKVPPSRGGRGCLGK